MSDTVKSCRRVACLMLVIGCVACARPSDVSAPRSPDGDTDTPRAVQSSGVNPSDKEWNVFAELVFAPETIRRQDIPFGYQWVPVDQEFRSVLNVGFTAVAVGPQVLLTSAHALQADRTLDPASGYAADCDIAPGYPDVEPTADLALCRTREPLRLRYYDAVLTETRTPRPYSQVRIVGFGCSRTGRSPSGRLSYRNDVDVLAWPTTDHGMFLDACYCGGDSGGPVFATIAGRRWVVGVNDEGICRSTVWTGCDPADGTCARATSTASLGDFIRGWAAGDSDFRTNPRIGTEPLVVCGVQDHSRCGWPIGSS